MQNHDRGTKARWIRIAIIFAVWAFFGSIFARQWSGDSEIWDRLFAVPPMAQHFADLGQVAAAVSSVQHGLDPYLNNRYDLDNRRFIYPRLWIYLFSALRITPQRAFVAGVMMACCFLVTISWLIARQQDLWACFLIALATCSGAAALAVERGNTDIVILGLVVLASELESRGSVSLLITAAVLKVYPFFALLAEAVMGRRRTTLLFLALTLAAAGILAQHADFARQESSIPHGYGLKEIDIAMQRAPTQIRAVFETHLVAFRVLWASALALLAAGGGLAGYRYGIRVPLVERPRGTYLYVLCSSIFVGTFLVSTSYDYRLIFLIPLVPFLLDRARLGSTRIQRNLGTAALCTIILGMNRGTARVIHSAVLTSLLKSASHVDLWALLWIVSFFLGLLRVTSGEAGVGQHSTSHRDAVDGLVKEPA